jgi:hypothetical protein
MMNLLKLAALALGAFTLAADAATPAVNYTHTNVLQNISLQLTIYQQGTTNSSGKKISDQVTTYTTKNLLNDLSALTGQPFGAGPKLVYALDFSNAPVPIGQSSSSNVLSTSIPVPTNTGAYLSVGGKSFYGFYGDSGVIVISGTNFETNGFGSVNSDIITSVGGPTTNTVTINTNAGYVTTITPQADLSDNVTNATIVTQFETAAPTENLLTNVASGFYVLYGTANNLLLVNNYLGFTTNSAEIVVENGINLNTTNPGVISQGGFSIQTLSISNYSQTSLTNGLTLNLQGFVKQALKLDTLYSHGTNKIVEYIFGANSTWSVNGSGAVGGTYTNNGGMIFLTNGTPVVAEGTVNISFLKNLPLP